MSLTLKELLKSHNNPQVKKSHNHIRVGTRVMWREENVWNCGTLVQTGKKQASVLVRHSTIMKSWEGVMPLAKGLTSGNFLRNVKIVRVPLKVLRPQSLEILKKSYDKNGYVLLKAWSSDMLSDCSAKFGGECHWITLHGNAKEGDGAHVMIGPQTGKKGHRRIVWAPEGTGLEHLNLKGMGSNEDIAKRVKSKPPKAKPKPNEEKGFKETVHEHKESISGKQKELHDAILDAVGIDPDKVKSKDGKQIDPAALQRAIGNLAGTKTEENSEENETPDEETKPEEGEEKEGAENESADETASPTENSDEEGAEPENSEGDEEKPGGEEEAPPEPTNDGKDDTTEEEAPENLNDLSDLVNRYAADRLVNSIEPGTARPADLSKVPKKLQEALDKMTPEQAQKIAQLSADLHDHKKALRDYSKGKLTRDEMNQRVATPATPEQVKEQIRKGYKSKARMEQNAALWQSVGKNLRGGSLPESDYRHAAYEVSNGLTSTFAESSLPTRLVDALGVDGTSQLVVHLAHQKGGAKGIEQLVSHIEEQADKLHDAGNVLDDVAGIQAQIDRNNKYVESGDLDKQTASSLNAKLSSEAQRKLATSAGRLEMGANIAAASRKYDPSKPKIKLSGGHDPEAIKTQMDAIGLGKGDYTVTPNEDGDYDVEINPSSIDSMIKHSAKEKENDAIREGKTVKDYTPPKGWGKLQLRPEQVQHVQFFDKNRRTLMDASTGAGKSAAFLAMAMKVRDEAKAKGKKNPRILVLTTAGVRQQFGEDALKFAPSLGKTNDVSVINGTATERRKAMAGKQMLTIAGHDSLVDMEKDIFAQDWDAILVDEADKMISPSAGQPSARGEVFEKLSKASPNLVCGTATPLRNSSQEYFKMLHLLNPEKFSNFEDFAEKYSNLGDGTTAYDDAISDALKNETQSTVLSTRLGEGHLHEHSDKKVPIMSDKKWRAMHKEVEQQYDAMKKTDPNRAASFRDIQHQRISYNVSADNPAQVEARKVTDEAFKKGEKGVVFADLKDILNTFTGAHKPGEWLPYTGDLNDEERQNVKDALNHGKVVPGIRVGYSDGKTAKEGVVQKVTTDKNGKVSGYHIKDDTGKMKLIRADSNVSSKLRGIAATKAAQYGLNLQDGASYVLRLGAPYTPTGAEQENGRLRSREQSKKGRKTWDMMITTDHPVAGGRRKDIFDKKSQLKRGRELALEANEDGAV